jgi:hypothetical protein
VGDEPGHHQGGQEGEPHDDDVDNVEVVVVLVRLCHDLPYYPEAGREKWKNYSLLKAFNCAGFDGASLNCSS